MKKILVVFLCLCLIITGCGGNTDKDTDTEAEENLQDDNEQADGTEQEKDNGEQDNEDELDIGDNQGNEDGIEGELQSFRLSAEWADVQTAEFAKPVFAIPEYEAEVEPYTIAEDLSNIENINQFSGFTKEQVKALSENGFVVLPTRSTRMHYVYDTNEYKGIPNFITADAVLHTYHQFYDKSLTNIETGYLYQDLELLTKQMLGDSIILLNKLEEEELVNIQKRNIVYFLVARMLMAVASDGGAEAVIEELENYAEQGILQEIIVMAESEYALIEKAEGYSNSPYFGFDFDYSQFKVRGHYTKSEELGRFFKTMMWYGTAPLPFIDKQGEYQYENTLQSLLMSFTTFLESEDTCSAELWTSIYQPTSQYVGLSDDIDVFTMNGLRISVFGESEDPNIFNDQEYYDKLFEAVKALPGPKIQGEFIIIDTPTAKQFRYMGQRYILDSYVMQNLTNSLYRPYPSSLDVMGVLGSSTAEELLFNYYKPQEIWPEYETIYRELYEEVSEYGIDLWSNNLYNGWVWSLQEELTEFDKSSGMPFFMTTAAWRYKALNTALGSYTELKHDTVLYGKQSVAEAGGYITSDYHYVEPNIPLYSKLLYLTDNTIKVLEEQGMMNDKMAEGAERYKELLELLIVCSIKELRNETLTEDEYRRLLSCGGIMERISQLFLEGITGGDFSTWDISDMLVTDVATCLSTYLSLGSGYFDEIYVVVPVGGKLYLSRGPVYSHYEFISDTRLTDEEWWELQGITINHEGYGDYPEYIEPSDSLPEQPFWVSNFKSDSNEVDIKSLEVVWGNMVEVE